MWPFKNNVTFYQVEEARQKALLSKEVYSAVPCGFGLDETGEAAVARKLARQKAERDEAAFDKLKDALVRQHLKTLK